MLTSSLRSLKRIQNSFAIWSPGALSKKNAGANVSFYMRKHGRQLTSFLLIPIQTSFTDPLKPTVRIANYLSEMVTRLSAAKITLINMMR